MKEARRQRSETDCLEKELTVSTSSFSHFTALRNQRLNFSYYISVDMEEGEGWKEKPRANNTRARIADALFQYSNKFAQFISQWVRVLAYMRTDAEAYLRKVVLNQGEKGLSDHERRKHKHSKLKQIITPLRTGRVGFVFLLLAVIGMLAYISQDTSVHHVERDSVRGTLASQANNARYSVHPVIQLSI